MSMSSVVFPAPAPLSGPMRWSTTRTWHRWAGASESWVATITTPKKTSFHINFKYFWAPKKLKSIATACLFKRFVVALRTKKNQKMTLNFQNAKKNGQHFPLYHSIWGDVTLGDFRLSIEILCFHKFSIWKVVLPQFFNSESCGSTIFFIVIF